MSPPPPAPHLQCSTGTFWAFELERAMDLLAEAGFSQIELMVTRDPKTHVPEIPRRLAAERGLKIAAVHGPFLVVTRGVWGQNPLEKVSRGIAMCRELGAQCLIVHPPFLWEREYAQWLRRRPMQTAAETGVTVAVETMYPLWVAGRKLRAQRWLDPRELYDAAPFVALDTSHLAVARQDILDAYQLLAPKLAHVHLSDNAGDGRDGHLELERGILPIERFLAELRRTHYAGAISLELSVSRYLERGGELVRMLRRNREYVKARLMGEVPVKKGMPRR